MRFDQRDDGEIERALAAFAREPNGGVIITASAAAVTHRELIISLVTRYRLLISIRFDTFPRPGVSPPTDPIRSKISRAPLRISIAS